MPDLVAALEESLLLVRLQKLTKRVDNLKRKQDAFTLGPRVIRARLRLIQTERAELEALARKLGHDVK